MNGFWTPFFRVMAQFFSGWGKILLSSAPAWARAHLLWSKPFHEVPASVLDSAAPPALTAGSNISLILDEKSRLHYRFNVPDCAGSELSRAVTLEAERVLPVKASTLVTAFSSSHEKAGKNAICIDLVAARRSQLAHMVDRLRQAGCSVGAVSALVPGREQPIEIPLPDIQARRSWRIAATIVFVFAAILSMSRFAAIYADRVEAEMAAIDQRIVAARSATRQIATLQSQVREKKGLSEALEGLIRSNRMVLLMEVLAKASPDHVVIETMRVDKDQLQISGVAQDPEEWAIGLSKVSGLEEVVVMSARELTSGTGERFQIRMNLSWPALWEPVQ